MTDAGGRDCQRGPRPCPYHACRYQNHTHDCALDHVQVGGATLREIGEVLGLTPKAVADELDAALSAMRARGVHLPQYRGSVDPPESSARIAPAWRTDLDDIYEAAGEAVMRRARR